MQYGNVAVIGGGIGGLASAILLSRRGCEVTVYEKSVMAGPVGAGFLLQPPGQNILRNIGVLDSITNQSVAIKRLVSTNSSGSKILDLDYSDLDGGGRLGLGVQRSTIYGALYEVAVESENIKFEWNSRVEDCDNVGDYVSVKVNDCEHRFDFVILSAGSNSELADSLFPDRVNNTYDWGCMWTTFSLPESLSPDTLHQKCSLSSKMLGVLPVLAFEGYFEAALYWSMPTKQMREINAQTFPALKAEIIDFWPEIGSSVESLSYQDFIPAIYRDIWTPKPYTGRIAAIGDISHGTSPQLGQGCTMALLDAFSLVESLMGEPTLTNALEKWWGSRKYQIMYIRHLSRFLTPLFQSDVSIYSAFRDYIMAPMSSIPFLYRLQLRTLASEVLLDSGITKRCN